MQVDRFGNLVDFDDCGPPMSQIFFDVYMLVAIMVMYQLMIGVVVDQVNRKRCICKAALAFGRGAVCE